jgi:hypothetical protein
MMQTNYNPDVLTYPKIGCRHCQLYFAQKMSQKKTKEE